MNIKKILLLFVLLQMVVSGSFAALAAEANDEGLTYCVPGGDRNVRYNPTTGKVKDWTKDRRIKEIKVTGNTKYGVAAPFSNVLNNAAGQTAVAVDSTNAVIYATKGDVLKMSWNWRETIDWMHYYIYIDYNHDGVFDESKELVSYTYYSATEAEVGTNSAGEKVGYGDQVKEAPSFTIPADALIGKTRLRFKLDWNSKNPCGNPDENNKIGYNGGTIIDYTIDIANLVRTTYAVTIAQPENGTLSLKKADDSEVKSGDEVEEGTSLNVDVIAKTPEFHLKNVIVNDAPITGTSFVVTKATTVTATLTSDWKVLYNTPEVGGALNVTIGSTAVENGSWQPKDSQLKVALLPSKGYEVATVTINGVDVKAQFTAAKDWTANFLLNEQKDIQVSFQKIKYGVKFEQTGDGELTIKNGDALINSGDKIDYGTELKGYLTYKASTTVETLTLNGKDIKETIASNKTFTFVVGEETQVVVAFKGATYKLSYAITGSGKLAITKDADNSVIANNALLDAATDITIVPEADAKWIIHGFKVNGFDKMQDLKDFEGEYYITMDRDVTIVAEFVPAPIGFEKVEKGKLIIPSLSANYLVIEGTQGGDVVSLYDLTGTLLFSGKANGGMDKFELGQIASGCYIVSVQQKEGQFTQKVIKK